MKKNKVLKLASGLLVLCLLTTCVIGTTLAKYTTGDSAADTARVAKWGVEVSTSGTMFGKAYKDVIVDYGSTDPDTMSVKTSDSAQKVVAPGTKNEVGILIKIKGKPEVDFKLDASKTNVSDIYLEAGTYGTMVPVKGVNYATDFEAEKIYVFDAGEYVQPTAYDASYAYYKLLDKVTVTDKYYPIVWTGTFKSTATAGQGDGKWSQKFGSLALASTNLVDGIKGLGANSGFFHALENVDVTYKLTWSWAYENTSLDYADGADTILANLMAGAKVVKLNGSADGYVAVEATDYNLTVGCEISVSATQQD